MAGRMLNYAAHRLLIALPVLFGVLVIGFLLLQIIPSDPAVAIAGQNATQAEIESVRQSLGLDRPIWLQFALYLSRVVQFDLGRSMISNRFVTEELALAFGPTVELMLVCLLWAIPAGIAAGTLAAVKRGMAIDRFVMALSIAGVSMPVFWIGFVFIHYVGVKLELLPFQGRGGPLWTTDGLRHIALPALTLGLSFIGPIARLTRTALVEVLSADYVRTARAKGLAEIGVVLTHALPNALIPVVTVIGLQIGYLLGGAVVTETVFAWPGLGRLTVGAIAAQDFPLVQGAILIIAVSFISINLLVDIMYAYLDPRVLDRRA